MTGPTGPRRGDHQPPDHQTSRLPLGKDALPPDRPALCPKPSNWLVINGGAERARGAERAELELLFVVRHSGNPPLVPPKKGVPAMIPLNFPCFFVPKGTIPLIGRYLR